MNTLTIYLSSPTPSSDMLTELSAAPIKGYTNVILDLINFDESQYKVQSINIDWGDNTSTELYKRNPTYNYATESIFDEILYGKIGGTITTKYNHYFSSASAFNSVIYHIIILKAYYENGFTHRFDILLPIYPASYYDILSDLNILSTQVTSISSNYTFINFESEKNGQSIVCILSS